MRRPVRVLLWDRYVELEPDSDGNLKLADYDLERELLAGALSGIHQPQADLARSLHLHPVSAADSELLEEALEGRGNLFYADGPAPELRLTVASWAPDTGTRKRAAVHPSTPEHALSHLVRDPASDVRIQLALRERLPAELARLLAIDREISVRIAVAMRDDLASELALRLARDNNVSVRALLAHRKPMPADLYQVLARDPEAVIRRDARQSWEATLGQDVL